MRTADQLRDSEITYGMKRYTTKPYVFINMYENQFLEAIQPYKVETEQYTGIEIFNNNSEPIMTPNEGSYYYSQRQKKRYPIHSLIEVKQPYLGHEKLLSGTIVLNSRPVMTKPDVPLYFKDSHAIHLFPGWDGAGGSRRRRSRRRNTKRSRRRSTKRSRRRNTKRSSRR